MSEAKPQNLDESGKALWAHAEQSILSPDVGDSVKQLCLFLKRELALEDNCNRLENAIREHRSQKADDRCIEDDDRLYEALGDGIKCDRRVGCKEDMLKNCARFIERRCEGGQWPSYATLADGIRHGAKMATDLWERLGEEGPLANEASMIAAHLMGTIISEDGLDTP